MISICGVICYFLIVSRLTQALSSLCFIDSLNNISVDDRFEIRFFIKVGICLIIFEGWLDSLYMYCIYSLGLKEMPTIQHKQNKYYLCLNKSLKSTWKLAINLLTSVETKISSPFYGMIAMNKNFVFTELFFAVFSLWSAVWPVRLMIWIIWFSKQKLRNSKKWFHWEVLQGIFSVKTVRKWRHPFVWILLHFNFFCYTLLSFDWRLPWDMEL